MILHPASSHVAQSWKNGGGATREMVRLPRDSASPFTFRLSLATVASDGPFSLFPGISRVLIVTEGEGMALHGPSTKRVLPRFEPIAFSGEEPIEATLVSGPTTDFNVMWSEDAFPGLAVRFAKGVESVAGFAAIVVLLGRARLRFGEKSHGLETYDAAVLQPGEHAGLEVGEGAVVALVAKSV